MGETITPAESAEQKPSEKKETKTVAFRAFTGTIIKFDKHCEGFPTKAEAFESLFQAKETGEPAAEPKADPIPVVKSEPVSVAGLNEKTLDLLKHFEATFGEKLDTAINTGIALYFQNKFPTEFRLYMVQKRNA